MTWLTRIKPLNVATATATTKVISLLLHVFDKLFIMSIENNPELYISFTNEFILLTDLSLNDRKQKPICTFDLCCADNGKLLPLTKSNEKQWDNFLFRWDNKKNYYVLVQSMSMMNAAGRQAVTVQLVFSSVVELPGVLVQWDTRGQGWHGLLLSRLVFMRLKLIFYNFAS